MNPSAAYSPPPLLFAHANGFPGMSYRSLLTPLQQRFTIHAVERLGHHPDYPVGANWLALRDELLEQAAATTGPVVGVGHSMGGVLMAMAAEQAPEHFRCIVMLDPPLMLGMDAWSMKLAKRFGFIDRVTPAGKSKGRRAEWPDREAMASHLGRRGLFRRFTPEALLDYVEGGSRLREDGSAELLYDPAIETEIFRHLPDHLSRVPRRLKVPFAVLVGSDSDLITPRRRRRLAAHGIALDVVPGTHMFPMEHPEETRQALLSMVDRLLAESKS